MIPGAIGAVVYVEGHGMHLAANWINNESPSTIAHLWDEDIGHHVWYAETLVMALATATAFTAWGAATRAGAGRLLVAAYAPALAAILVTLI